MTAAMMLALLQSAAAAGYDLVQAITLVSKPVIERRPPSEDEWLAAHSAADAAHADLQSAENGDHTSLMNSGLQTGNADAGSQPQG